MSSAPCGPRWASKPARVTGGQPRSLPTSVEGARVAGKEVVGRLLRRGRDVAERVHADLQLVRRMPGSPAGLAIEIDERTEAAGLAADDRDHQRKPERAGASERLRASRRRPARWATGPAAVSGRRPDPSAAAELARPVDVLVVPDLEKQVELLREERVVVLEPQTEQRERVDERTAADDHLRAALRKQVERGELLEDTHRIGRAQHRHGARQPDALGARRRRGEDHRRGGVEELLAMVLADPEHIEPDLVGVLDLLDQVAQALRRADARLARRKRRRSYRCRSAFSEVELRSTCRATIFFMSPRESKPAGRGDYPRVPGHEALGRIDALGGGVEGWKLGQRVGVGYLAGNCGYCEFCRDGNLVGCQNRMLPACRSTAARCSGHDCQGRRGVGPLIGPSRNDPWPARHVVWPVVPCRSLIAACFRGRRDHRNSCILMQVLKLLAFERTPRRIGQYRSRAREDPGRHEGHNGHLHRDADPGEKPGEQESQRGDLHGSREGESDHGNIQAATCPNVLIVVGIVHLLARPRHAA